MDSEMEKINKQMNQPQRKKANCTNTQKKGFCTQRNTFQVFCKKVTDSCKK